MSDHLKPCPFCGGEMCMFIRPAPSKEATEFGVRCLCDKLPGTGWLPTQDDVIERWNTRAACQSCAELKAEVERLREALRVITDVVPENYLRTVEAALEGGTDADEVSE